MKLKMIAAALAIGLSAQAHAAIDIGSNGNGELFLNVWDASGSYTRDLNLSIDAFQSSIAAGGLLDLSWTSDATFSSFLGGVADVASLKWNIVATDRQGAVRNLVTYTPPVSATLVSNTVNRGTIAASIQNQAIAYNAAAGGADSAVFTSADAAYAGKTTFGDRLNNGLKADSFAFFGGNLSIMRIDSPATGTGNAVYNPYSDSGEAINIWFDANNGLHIAAVPEPEGYAMLLAGLGMIGAIARRRRNLV